MTTLPPDVSVWLPEIERVTGLNVSDLLRVGLVKIIQELKGRGALQLTPVPAFERLSTAA